MNLLDIKRKLLPMSGYAGSGGGGGGGSQNVNSTVTNSNIPAYAQPYVEGMLGATQKQIFQGNTDAEGNYNITGFQPYRAFGGDYDEQGNQTGYDPSAGIAGFSPLQTQAQTGIGNLQAPDEFNDALDYTGNAMEQARTDYYDPSYYENQYQAPDNLGYNARNSRAANAGDAYTADSQGYDASTYGGDNAGPAERFYGENANAAQLGAAPTETAATGIAQIGGSEQFGGPRDVNARRASEERVDAPNLRDLSMDAAKDVTTGALQSQGIDAAQMGPAERVNTKSFTDQGTADSYMSPYMQNVVGVQQREAQRAANVATTGRRGEQTRAGAFGGSRAAIMDAEAARNLATQQGDIQAQGSQAAYQQAQQQFNAEQGQGLQAQTANQQAGLTVGSQNLNAQQQTNVQNEANRLQAQGMSSSQALQAALANQGVQQQTNLQNLSAGLQTQGLGAQTGLQAQQSNQQYNMQGQLANQQTDLAAQQSNQGMDYNTGMQNAQMRQQMGLANLGNRQQTEMANVGNRQQTNLANQAQRGQFALQQGQFDQAANAQTSAQRQAAGMGNQQAANQMAQYNAGNRQQAGMQNAALRSQASQFGAGAANQAQLTNAQARNQMAQYNAGNQQQTNLANQNAQNQARQFGAGQNLTSAQTRAQYGSEANRLNEQSRQFGASNRQQNLQAQLQAANQYGQLGNQRLAAQQGILGLQNATGAQQQAYKQQINNQAMQDYANAQQYPMMQLGTMSNMLRGLPMQAQSTQMYAAQPNFATQAIGTTGALMNYPYERKASGGLASIPKYDVGGSVRSKLEDMTSEDLKDYLKSSSSPAIKQMAQAILREKMGMAGGGIIAFREGDPIDEQIAQAYNAQRETPRDVAEQQAAAVTGSNRPGTVAPPPRAAAPNPRAITAVPPQAPAQTQGPAQAPSLMDFTEEKKSLEERKTVADAKQALADRPQSAFIAEAQAGRKELGLDQNEALATQRANVMAEKASLKDEAEYKRKMTLVKFFAAWGSTPGNTLVAGMKQFEKTIPELLQNADDEKKARKETDKVIYELDNAVRLEKMGLYSEATASKNKAAELANVLQEQVRKANEAMLKAQKDIAVSQQQFKTQLEVADKQAAGSFANASATRDATKANNDARLEADKRNKELGRIAGYEKQIETIKTEYERSKAVKSGEYYKANDIVNRYKDKDKEKLEPEYIKKLNSANKILSDLDAAQDTRINGIQQKLDDVNKKLFDIDPVSRNPAAPPAGFVPDKK